MAGDAHLSHKGHCTSWCQQQTKTQCGLIRFGTSNKKRNVSLEVKSNQSCQRCIFGRGELYFSIQVGLEQKMANPGNSEHLIFHIIQWFYHHKHPPLSEITMKSSFSLSHRTKILSCLRILTLNIRTSRNCFICSHNFPKCKTIPSNVPFQVTH